VTAVAEKAQHEPHCPWSLTAFTAPLVLQSMEAGIAVSSRITTAAYSAFFGILYPRSLLYSASVQVENWL